MFNVTSLMASDLAREKRIMDQIIDAILDGDAQMLSADGHEFLSIHTEADDAKGAVLILHGRGFHPDWVDAINPLRVGLVEHGWNTLSIQLPVLEKTAKYYDYVPIFGEATPRIEAAIDFLRQQGNKKIILLAHSCGVHMAMHYVREMGEKKFDAYVGIGMGATDYKQTMSQPFPLDQIKKPILDIFAGDDYPAVHRLAAIHAQQMQAEGNNLFKQVKIPGANHYFTNMGDPLVETVADWLENLK
jgi:alpha/beta superfamily hydrolase